MLRGQVIAAFKDAAAATGNEIADSENNINRSSIPLTLLQLYSFCSTMRNFTVALCCGSGACWGKLYSPIRRAINFKN